MHKSHYPVSYACGRLIAQNQYVAIPNGQVIYKTLVSTRDMIRNYVKVAFRNLLRQKGFSVINVFGLSLGLTCCLLIAVYVVHELSYDRYHKNVGQIYRVVEDIIRSHQTVSIASTAGPVAPHLLRDFPEVLRAVRIRSATTMLVQFGENRFQENDVYFADSTIFSVFSFPLLKGNPRTVLTAPSSIVLSTKAAQKYFGDMDPIGQTLLIDSDHPFTVTGVFEDIPLNSHLRFDFLLSMSTMADDWLDGWSWSAHTYIQLAPGYDASDLEKKFPQFVERHPDHEMLKKNEQRALSLERLADVHLHSKRSGEPSTGNLSNLYLFSFIGIFILVIACVNFINLTTARAARRALEIGMRKVIGGTRLQLALQFLAESVLVSLGSSILALGFCSLLLPEFANMIGVPITTGMLFSPLMIVTFICLSLLVGCLAGSYPAFFLSGFQPAQVLKSKLRSSSQEGLLRKGLIVFQFTISIVLIVGTVIVFTQLRFMREQDLGYNQEQMLILSFGDDIDVQQKAEAIKQELLRSPYVDKVATSSHVPGKKSGLRRTEIENVRGVMQAVDMHLFAIDYDFISLYEITLSAGRGFSPTHVQDATNSFMINEAAARELGFGHPDEVVSKQLSLDGMPGTIVGVVKDFHFMSLHQRIEPLVMRMRPQSLSYISIPIRSAMIPSTMEDVEKRWRILAPHRPFDYFFLNEQFDLQYRGDKQFGRAFGVSAMIAITLACLGLFGLVSFTVQQRTKEIGIRKVFGATVSSVAGLVSKEFVKLVLIAILIATPFAWYTMSRWLQGFAYRIELQWWMFLLAGVLALLIALITVSFQSVKAALMNPVKSLRSE